MAHVVVGVSGGIAAYKSVSLVRLLTKAGHDVTVIPTASALRFVGRPTWEAISHRPVSAEVFDDVASVRHVAIGQSADLILVAPATANTIAKLAHGLSDDLLGTTVLASRCPLVVAPAMHTEMWQHPATQANVDLLRSRGVVVLGPDSGPLTGDDDGPGRMVEPEELASNVERLLAGRERDLVGRRVLVSAGGTREAIDPVRFLGNHSSGKQGLAIAQAAHARGAEVTLVLGSNEVVVPTGLTLIRAETAELMRERLLERQANQDIVVMAAAIADFRPATVSTEKLRKAELGGSVTLGLVQNPDVLRELVAQRPDGQVIVGFAAETGSPTEVAAHGRAKLERKGCDLLVVNRVGPDEHGVERVFGADSNEIEILSRGVETSTSVRGDKVAVADAVLDAALARLTPLGTQS